MADFQYVPSEADPVVQLRRAMDRMDGIYFTQLQPNLLLISAKVDFIKEYVIPDEKEDYILPVEHEQPGPHVRSNLRLLPPPLFSPQGIPQIYKCVLS